jgi:hypothetical protein
MTLLIAALFAEVGLVLAVVPWSPLWERNYFFDFVPHLRVFLMNNYVRGAVSGLGLINIAAGILELVALFASRPLHQPAQVFRSEAAQDGH